MPELINNISLLHEFYSLMQKHEILMVYEGEFSQEITKSVLSMTENSFHSENIDASVKKKVYNIMMEALQNICKHEFKSAESTNMASLFIISSMDDKFCIITGNAIQNNIISILKNKIDQVNALDQDGLKTLYKDARLNSTISAVGGAGLGFIDIARKSGEPILYHFLPINETTSFFTQLVSVKKHIE